MAENKKKEDLEDKRSKLDAELQKNEEDQTVLEELVNIVIEQRKELENQRKEIRQQKEAMEKKFDEIETNVHSVDKETESDRAKAYLGLTEIILDAKNSLRDRKKDNEKLEDNTSELIKKIDVVTNKITDRKRAVENHMKEIREQQQQIEKQ